MKKKVNLILSKCKSLSRQLTRSSSCNISRSSGSREEHWGHMIEEQRKTVFVGSTRREYEVSSKQLNHPLLKALVDHEGKSKNVNNSAGGNGGDDHIISVRCEVVLFDHLLWMLDNAETQLSTDSLQELAELYRL